MSTLNIHRQRKKTRSSSYTIFLNDYRTINVNFLPVPPSGNNPFEEIPFLCGQNSILMTTNSGANGGANSGVHIAVPT